MIDWDFEDRLIERVQARKAIAEALDPRQRRFLRAYTQGATYQDIAKAEGLSANRVRIINLHSVERLSKWARGWRPPPPPPPKPPKPKPYVDPVVARERLLAKEQRILRTMLEVEEEERRAAERRLQDKKDAFLRQTQEQTDWIRALQVAIAACEGTHYAILIPQMMADIANIRDQPPGPLPWRFDPVAFQRHFASFKAQVDAGTYRSV